MEEQQRSKEMQQLGDALQRLHADQRNAVDRAAVAARSSDPQVRLYAVRLTTTQEHVDAQLVRSAHDAGLPVSGAAYTAEEQRLQSSLPPPSPDSQFLSGAQTLAQGASQNAGELAQVATSRHQVALVTVAQQAKGSHASSLAQARSLEAAGSSSTGGTGGTSQ